MVNKYPHKILGLTGWSGAGKTTMGEQLIAALTARGLRIASLKHAHHSFDIDHPGKDSFKMRAAGARQVLITSAKRWALMEEVAETDELGLTDALTKLSPCDLVLVEGFKRENFPKLEIHRPAVGKPLLYGQVPGIEMVATDAPLAPDVPQIDLNDFAAVLAWVSAFYDAAN